MKPCLKSFLFILLTSIAITSYAQYNGVGYNMFIHDKLHNSYTEIRAFKPYAIVIGDTLVLKGYVDAVSKDSFVFATRDSVYILSPDMIGNAVRISGFGSKNDALTSRSLASAGGVIMIVIGSITLIPGIAVMVDDEIVGGAITTFIASGLIAGGALLIRNHGASSYKDASDILDDQYYISGKPRYRLKIVKSTL